MINEQKNEHMPGIVFKKSESEKVALNDFIESLSDRLNDDRSYKNRSELISLSAEPGRKYIRIVEESYGSRSVYCFLDYDGNIYKSASWKTPAKHVRGSVFDANYSYGKALGPYGASYLR
jgi:hypothetical protein